MHHKNLHRTSIAAVLVAVTTLGTQLTAGPQAYAATYPSSIKEININGQSFVKPWGIVANSTTYMPIWYVQQALKKLGITNTWSNNNWNITTGTKAAPSANPGHGTIGLYVNGALIYRVNGISYKDPASGNSTTYVPVYNVMQILKAAAIPNTWDGKHWNINLGAASTGGSSSSTSSQTGSSLISNFKGATTTQNNAVDDSKYWIQASNDLYVSAQTYDPSLPTNPGPTMSTVKTGQKIYLYAYSNDVDVNSATWQVNSPDAAITTVPGTITDSYYKHTKVEATFVASKPGIYTIQAASNGKYSVPLVLIVGLDQLTGTPFATQSPTQDGVQPPPATLPSGVQSVPTGDITYYPYQVQSNGWLPVKGQVTPGSATEIVVDIMSKNGQDEWNYTLPIAADGSFGALVRVPFQGDATVRLLSNFLKQLNMSSGWLTHAYYSVTNSTPIAAETDKALLASGLVNYNMSAEFNQTASVIMRNSPTLKTGIVAISNFVTGKLEYDWRDYNNGVSVWQFNTQAWQDNTGVCQDIAETTSGMLRSIGLPAETVIGKAPKTETWDDHEWLRAYTGTEWITLDPTWNSPGRQYDLTNDFLTSEFTTQTSSFSDTHAQDITGSWQ